LAPAAFFRLPPSDSAAAGRVNLVLSSLFFSLSFGLIKAEVSALDPFAVAFIRLALSFLAFSPFLRRLRFRAAAELLVIGAIQFGLMYCFYIASYRTLAGHQVALLTISTPIWVILIEGAIARRIATEAALAAVIAIAAGLVVTWSADAPRATLEGAALVQGANVCFAIGQVLYRRGHGGASFDDRRRFAWLYLGAILPPLVGLFFLHPSAPWPHTVRQWLSLAYLGLVPSALGFYLWNRGAARVGTGTLAVMNNLKVPLAVLLAWLFFGESMDVLRIALGFGLLGAALVLAHRQRSRL
jgi:drug/metabolite transporter (DMT)-like permease